MPPLRYKTIRPIPGKPGYARQVGEMYTKSRYGRKRYIKGTGPKPLTEKVKTIIKRQQETKYKVDAPANYNTNQTLEEWTPFTSGITSTNELYRLIPNVAVGDNDHQRIGNVIQPVSLTTKVNLAVTSSTSMSVYADIFFLTSKTVKDFELTNGIDTASLMNKGDGTNVPYDGTSYTGMLPINKTEFTVIAHKRFLLQKGNLDPNAQLSGSAVPSTDTFSYTKSFSQRIPLPQKLLYEIRTKEQPTNAFPFMCVGFVGTDTNGNLAPITARIGVQAQSHLYYKDA